MAEYIIELSVEARARREFILRDRSPEEAARAAVECAKSQGLHDPWPEVKVVQVRRLDAATDLGAVEPLRPCDPPKWRHP